MFLISMIGFSSKTTKIGKPVQDQCLEVVKAPFHDNLGYVEKMYAFFSIVI